MGAIVVGQTASDIAERTMMQVAREIAMDMHEVPEILQAHGIDEFTWSRMQANPQFQALLTEYVSAWRSSTKAPDRLRLKAAIMLEEWLPELNNRMHSVNEPLNAKVEAAKMLARIAGVGQDQQVSAGEKFTVTINLGNNDSVKIEQSLPAQVIDNSELCE